MKVPHPGGLLGRLETSSPNKGTFTPVGWVLAGSVVGVGRSHFNGGIIWKLQRNKESSPTLGHLQGQ